MNILMVYLNLNRCFRCVWLWMIGLNGLRICRCEVGVDVVVRCVLMLFGVNMDMIELFVVYILIGIRLCVLLVIYDLVLVFVIVF